MFRKLSISKTVDAMVTEKVGVGRAKVPGYSKSKENGKIHNRSIVIMNIKTIGGGIRYLGGVSILC